MQSWKVVQTFLASAHIAAESRSSEINKTCKHFVLRSLWDVPVVRVYADTLRIARAHAIARVVPCFKIFKTNSREKWRAHGYLPPGNNP